MAEHADREHYIPIRVTDLITLLSRDRGPGGSQPMSDADREAFLQFCHLGRALIHHEYQGHLEKLKDTYFPFDPDRDTKPVFPLTEAEKRERQSRLFDEFTWLLQRANYRKLTETEILDATESASAWGINMDVCLDVFDQLAIFARGYVLGKRSVRRWNKFWQTEVLSIPIYQRLVLIFRQKSHRRLPPDADTTNVFLKIFKDIPRVDLEMLLPGTRLKMPKVERGKLGASIASAIGYVAWKLYGTVSVGALMSGNPMALYGPTSLILGYGYKQYYGYTQTKQSYEMKLTQSLYYQNLDSNAGVLYRLVDEAEEQDAREALLGYYYLWRYAGEKGWTTEQLDDYIELDLERQANVDVDFEIADSLGKLERMGLIERVEGDRWRAVPLARALDVMDTKWDNFFQFSGTTAAP